MRLKLRVLFSGISIVALYVSALPCDAQSLRPHTLVIAHWPEDVPCNVLKKYPDGTYEITVPYMLYYTLHSGTKLKNLRVTRYWDRKCMGTTN